MRIHYARDQTQFWGNNHLPLMANVAGKKDDILELAMESANLSRAEDKPQRIGHHDGQPNEITIIE